MKTVILASGNELLTDKQGILGLPVLDYTVKAAKDMGSEEIFLATDLNIEWEGIKTIKIRNNSLSELANCLEEKDRLLILPGDRPVLNKELLNSALSLHNQQENKLTCVNTQDEEFTGVMIIEGKEFKAAVNSYSDNSTPEEIREYFIKSGFKIGTHVSHEPELFIKTETYVDLEKATKILRRKINELHMLNKVNIMDSDNTYISPTVKIGGGTIIYPGTVLMGATEIGNNCIIGGCHLTDTVVGDSTEILNSVTTQCKIGKDTHVGPFAYIRPNSVIGNNCKVGDFVEVKNSVIGDNTKASHLTYIGDSEFGNGINIGCGTITVNYDGSSKSKTIVEDDVFIGCNTNLIAPVRVGSGSFIAAGSTITDDVPSETLAIARSKQVIKESWKRPRKSNK